MKVKKRKLIADIKKINPEDLCRSRKFFNRKGIPWLTAKLAVNAGEEVGEACYATKIFLVGDTNIWSPASKLYKKYGGDYVFWLGLSNRYEYAKNRKKGIEKAVLW